MILQSPVHFPGKVLPLPADVKREVTKVVAAPDDCASESTGTAVQVKKFDVAHFCHEDLLAIVNQIKNPEIPLCDISYRLGFCRTIRLCV